MEQNEDRGEIEVERVERFAEQHARLTLLEHRVRSGGLVEQLLLFAVAEDETRSSMGAPHLGRHP